MTKNIVQNEIATGLRDALRSLVRPVAVITAEHNGQNFAMAATAFCEVSMDPPSMLVCVNRSNATFSVIAEGADIGLNFLADSHEELSKRCGGGATQNAKFDVGDWLLEEGKPPRLVDSCATMVLCPTQIVDHGTHAVVIGEITDVSSSSNRAPLSFHNGGYIFPLAKSAFN
ncbi:flavin reductase family protein [Parasphingorhabdus sp. JC815]|uniref:flavin reductase family protein n=1 Tax=Parasphingorhabdus sp. JC815 TaxID=3232140 RepID=UPI00345944CB